MWITMQNFMPIGHSVDFWRSLALLKFNKLWGALTPPVSIGSQKDSGSVLFSSIGALFVKGTERSEPAPRVRCPYLNLT
jgi:hypothetical protein